MVGVWMPLCKALEHVAKAVHSQENAKVQLRAKLEMAELAARADRLETDGGGCLLREPWERRSIPVIS
jgi:hypothetical protein